MFKILQTYYLSLYFHNVIFTKGLSSKPKNLEQSSKTNDSLSFQWQPPDIVDSSLENRFLVILSKCESSGTCRSQNVTEVNFTQTDWSAGGLVSNTLYHFIVCASNDVFLNNTLQRSPEDHESCASIDTPSKTNGRKSINIVIRSLKLTNFFLLRILAFRLIIVTNDGFFK